MVHLILTLSNTTNVDPVGTLVECKNDTCIVLLNWTVTLVYQYALSSCEKNKVQKAKQNKKINTELFWFNSLDTKGVLGILTPNNLICLSEELGADLKKDLVTIKKGLTMMTTRIKHA